MTSKQLLSLREIAQQLKINYNTLVSCKNYFEEYLQVRNIGRISKYQADYVDFFRLVFALKDQGYVMPEIVNIIQGKQIDGFEKSLAEWVTLWHFEVFNERTSERTNERMTELTNEPTNERTNESTDEWMNEPTNDLLDERTDGPSRAEIESLVPELIQDNLSELIAQLNSSITQFYKTVTELQEKVLDLDKRLRHLERELNGEPNGEMAVAELDLDRLQVGAPADSQEIADLEFVKASVENGKPDRDAIAQWVAAERQKDPSVSYARLAEILDEAGVPTLSGREGWNRASLRNLVAKNSG